MAHPEDPAEETYKSIRLPLDNEENDIGTPIQILSCQTSKGQ